MSTVLDYCAQPSARRAPAAALRTVTVTADELNLIAAASGSEPHRIGEASAEVVLDLVRYVAEIVEVP